MPRPKPTPERKSRSGSHMPNSLRGNVRLEIRCDEELRDRARAIAQHPKVTLADILEAGCDALEGSS